MTWCATQTQSSEEFDDFADDRIVIRIVPVFEIICRVPEDTNSDTCSIQSVESRVISVPKFFVVIASLVVRVKLNIGELREIGLEW